MRSSADRVVRSALLGFVAAATLACTPPAPPPAAVAPSKPVRAVRTPPPTYPDALACEGVGGLVELTLTINAQGRVGNVGLKRSSGQRLLDEAAIAAVRDWEFAPATRGGQPVPATISVPMNFRPIGERPDRCFALDEQG
jgi:protein TonB